MNQQTMETTGVVGAYPVCATCRASAVLRDAWAIWNRMTGRWELQATFDSFHCDVCCGETSIAWEIDDEFRTKRIRRLNDAFRQGDVLHGAIVVTDGIRALGDDALTQIVRKVSDHSEFTEHNDPHQEHDFGSFTHEEDTIFWKIDCFDRDLKWHSPDAANPEITRRVLTIMLASEY